ncbi:MAG TPA: FIST N-terminal domain-containing protein [Prolixibacteraceae bacterium]|nr:FIST N-terminal domain-containing protein [Prolixibacteraceae bacterium]
MKTEQRIYTDANGWVKKSDNNLENLAQLVFLFENKDLLKKQPHIDFIKSAYPVAQIVGCSTSGEICQEEVFNESIICTAVWFENSTVEVAIERINTMEDSFIVGEKLAEKLDKEQLVHIMILSEGLNINGSELTKGLNHSLKDRISITGGMAGDQDDFLETVIIHNTTAETNLVLAIGFYGENLKVGYGSMGGWDSFGVDREVTKSIGNVLYELDGQPALELYKKYLGIHAADLPSSALLFPLSLRSKNPDTALVRTVLSVNEKDGSMVFAGDIPQGEYVRLMKASSDRLIDGANDAAEMSKTSLGNSNPDLAILISCVGRKLVLKQRVEEELEIIREVIGNGANVTGFYSYGEICPIKPFEHHCELHNQTMTVTLFKEL